MSFKMVDGLFTIALNGVGTLALGTCLLLLGYYLRKKIDFFERCCFPAPVIGGLAFALLHCFVHMTGIASFQLDTMFQSPAMIAFFTCIGLTTSLTLIKKGGKLLIIYWLLVAVLCVMQSGISIGLSEVTGISPVYAVLAGTTTMMGGHGNGGSFGQTAVELGFSSGLSVGLACATFGLVAGSLLGGPFAGMLIRTFGLKPTEEDYHFAAEIEAAAAGPETKGAADVKVIMKHIAYLSVMMTVGSVCATFLSKFLGDVTLPGYVGGMFMAVIVRNINDIVKVVEFDLAVVDRFADVCLNVFLSIAMMSMKLWQLIDLAVPLMIILATQVVCLLIYARYICFPFLGKNYDAAVMCSGLMGHGLGATPNAMANMTAVTEKFGPSRKALIIVPLVAAALIDFVMIPTIVIFFNIAVKMAGG